MAIIGKKEQTGHKDTHLTKEQSIINFSQTLKGFCKLVLSLKSIVWMIVIRQLDG
jgi:hypothetical protein